MITALVLLGQVLELRARGETGAAIRKLLGLAPKTARRVGDDGARSGRAARSRPRRRPTARAAGREGPGRRRGDRGLERDRRVDGHRASRSRSRSGPATGSSARTVNGAGSFVMRAERVGAETLLARIVALVAEAQRSRAPIQRLADAVAGWFVLVVIAVAVADFAVWAAGRTRAAPRLRAGQRGRGADHRLSVRARARHADVDHGGDRAGRAKRACSSATPRRSSGCAKVDTLVVDKTGTLTEGRPKLVAVVPAEGFGADEIAARSPRRWSAAASIRSPRRSSPAPASAASRSRPPTGSSRSPAGRSRAAWADGASRSATGG